jgi:hypothetical protein
MYKVELPDYGEHCDKDIALAGIVLKLFIDFVEVEKPYELLNIEESPNQAEWIRLKKIYDKVKLNRARWEDDPHDEIVYEEVTETLVEVVKLRKMLWT